MEVRKVIYTKNGVVRVYSSMMKIDKNNEITEFEKALLKSQKAVNRLMDCKVKNMGKQLKRMSSMKHPFSRWELDRLLEVD